MSNLDDSLDHKTLAREMILDAGRRLIHDFPERLEKHDEVHGEFRTRLMDRWMVPLHCYFVTWQECRDFGATVPLSPTADEALIEALVGIHARACRVALEVFELLRNGLPRGAAARSRTMYELAVYSQIIADEPLLAPRFLAFSEVQRWKDAQAFNEASPGEQFSVEDMDKFRTRAEAASASHPGVERENGWASLTGAGSKFKDLVKKTALWPQYPYYNWFSHEVHARSRGGVLNILKAPDGEGVHLAGYTNAGLAAPGQSSILCLVLITSDLLFSCSSDDAKSERWIAAKVMADRANEHFAKVEDELQEEGLNLELSQIWRRPTSGEQEGS